MMPVYLPHHGTHHGPVPHQTFVHDFGLELSVPLVVVGLLALGLVLRSRRKRDGTLEQVRRGKKLGDGAVILHVTRVEERQLQRVYRARDPEGAVRVDRIAIEDAPIALAVGERGYVAGVLTRDGLEAPEEYRVSSVPCVARLLPVDGRYALLRRSDVKDDKSGLVVSLMGSIPFAVSLVLALVARGLPAGDARDWVSSGWITLVTVFGGVFVLGGLAVLLLPTLDRSKRSGLA